MSNEGLSGAPRLSLVLRSEGYAAASRATPKAHGDDPLRALFKSALVQAAHPLGEEPRRRCRAGGRRPA
eukprot:3275104-Prymnesium_polylepis.1